MFDLASVQTAIQQTGLDGWLLYDFRGLNVLARRVLGFDPNQMLSRRWFYLIPAHGEPRKLVHKIEPAALDQLPGSKRIYLKWQELAARLAAFLVHWRHIAMEECARHAHPDVSRVD